MEEAEIEGVKVPVVRLKMGEIAEATKVVVLPVAKASEGSKPVRDAPRDCRSDGEFGVVAAEKSWRRRVKTNVFVVTSSKIDAKMRLGINGMTKTKHKGLVP